MGSVLYDDDSEESECGKLTTEFENLKTTFVIFSLTHRESIWDQFKLIKCVI